jgi:CHAD domain-containing protein
VHAAALEQARQLDQLLGEVRKSDDEVAHRARIAGKRLRYVLEPVVAAWPDGEELIERLKAGEQMSAGVNYGF